MFRKIKRAFLRIRFNYYGLLYNIYAPRRDKYIGVNGNKYWNWADKCKCCLEKRQVILYKLCKFYN